MLIHGVAGDKSGPFRLKALAVALGAMGALNIGHATEINTGNPDFKARWDNTLQYNLGVRAQNIDSRIGNNPLFDESEYKFKRGDVVTNRITDLMEIDLSYKDAFGARLGGSAWYDGAYGRKVESNPGNVLPPVMRNGQQIAPATPYSSLISYSGGQYSDYTSRYYRKGGQILDAFVWGNTDLGGHYTSAKVGRLTAYWGNALFFGTQGINYAQNAADNIKGLTAPGTQAKELAIPREQVLLQTELTPELGVALQYFWKFQGNRLPEGGTYLAPVDFLFSGPNLLQGALPRGADVVPKENNRNYGVKMVWTPSWLNGSLGAYYRRLDETQPWAPLIGLNAAGAPNYHLAYATGVDMLGLSLDTQVAGLSTGFEVSYRRNTGLNSGTGPLPTDLTGREGARGNTLNVVANALAVLTRSSWYDTGTFLAELAYTRKLKVTSNATLYNGVENRAACPTGSKWDGCSTNNSLSLGMLFSPQWLQVRPGVDLSMPMFVLTGLSGNAASLGSPVGQGFAAYSFGLNAVVRQKYNWTLQYNGSHGHATGGLTDFTVGSSASLPAGASFAGAGPQYYASGNSAYMNNDKGWVSLTLKTSF
jgi:hypothetical protein